MDRRRGRGRRRLQGRERSLGERIKDWLRSFLAFMFSNVGIIGLVVGYTIAGAFVFRAIEGAPDQEDPSLRVRRMRTDTVARLWQLTCSLNTFSRAHWTTRVESELKLYQQGVVDAVSDGFDGSEVGRTGQQWSFSGAFLYSLTVITTIGYGNVTPKTEWGKMTTILYAIIGMPLFLLYLSNIGDILARSFKWTYAKCCLCRGCSCNSRRRALRRLEQQQQQQQLHHGDTVVDLELETFDPADVTWQGALPTDPVVIAPKAAKVLGDEAAVDPVVLLSEEDGSSTSACSSHDDPQAITVPVTLCLAIMVGYVLGGALLFSRYESWDLLDGSYFCFISLSTIGFGDLVPGDQVYAAEGIELSFILCSMYLMLGMALIAMCFNLMQEEVVAKARSLIASVRAICRCRRRTDAGAGAG